MSPYCGEVLLGGVMPIIQATVPRVIRPVGSETFAELVQDGMAIAAAMLDSAERRGLPLLAKSTAYYALQRLKTGRRSTGATRTDALCPAAQLDDNVTVASMDDAVETEEGEDLTLHELLAAPEEDPSQVGARELDWAELMDDLDERDLALIRTTINGDRLDLLAKQFGVSSPRVTQLKRELGHQIKLRWGPDALETAVRRPAWNASVDSIRERLACRHDRAMAARDAAG